MVKKLRAIYLGIAVVFSATIASLVYWPYMWEGEFLSKWASVVTILSLVVVPITYFPKQYEKDIDKVQKEITEKTKTARDLYGELFDALEAIKGSKYPKDLLDVKLDDLVATYTNRFLNHDVYDSLIFSGRIRFLDYELQQRTQDIFNMIKHHNYYLRLITSNQELEGGTSIPRAVWNYYQLLDSHEKRLLREIPDVMDVLKKRFDFQPPN